MSNLNEIAKNSEEKSEVPYEDLTQKTIKELKGEIIDQDNTIASTLLKLEKVNTILNLWVQEYIFNENPTPRKAIEWGNLNPGVHNIEGEQSYKWFYEYGRITTLIDMVHDYTFEAEKLLGKALDENH
jgi:hypothetical protein